MNYPEFGRWILVGVFLILMLGAIVLPVQGETFRPAQGDMVELGSTIDVTGVMGFGEGFAYYGYSGDLESDPLYVYTLPDRKSAYYQFYVDPAIFGTRLGPWFQFAGNNTGVEHGNLLAFRVVKQLPAVNLTNATATVAPTPTPIPTIVAGKRFDTDYQIARGDSFSVIVNNKSMPSRLWVFGRIDSIYNRSYPKSVVTLTAAELQKLELGVYQLFVQNPGKNGIFELGYTKTVDVANSKTVEELVGNPCTTSGCKIIRTSVFGFQPSMVLIKVLEMLKSTDDPIARYTVELSPPIIEIVSVDETYYEGKDVIDIRGYTNVAKNTPVVVIMDEEDQTARTFNKSVHMTVVQESTPNSWRYFQIYLPVDYETIPIGQHQITASTPQGARQSVPFYVYDLPKGQETPNETIKYIAGDIFVAPVTVTITIPVPGPTQTILVPVTPSNEQVYAQQKHAEDKKWEEKKSEYIGWGIMAVVGIVLVLVGWYAVRVVKRARLK